MTLRAYADESYRHTYVLALTVIDVAHESQVRKLLRSLCLPGQYRLHMKNEKDNRRRMLLAALGQMPIQIALIECRQPSRVRRLTRDLCLREAVRLLASLGVSELVLESCGQDQGDRQILAQSISTSRVPLTYSHTSPRVEPLVWPSDLVAWAFGKNSVWRGQVANLIGSVTRVLG